MRIASRPIQSGAKVTWRLKYNNWKAVSGNFCATLCNLNCWQHRKIKQRKNTSSNSLLFLRIFSYRIDSKLELITSVLNLIIIRLFRWVNEGMRFFHRCRDGWTSKVALIWLHYFNWLLLILLLNFLLLLFLFRLLLLFLFLLRLLLPLLLALLSLANLSPYQIALTCSRSCYLRLQFLTPIVFRSSPTESSHLHFGFPTCRVPFVLRTASCLQWSSSCIL
jgi:hypothetical protein